MAKANQNSGREGQSKAPPSASEQETEALSAPAPKASWRRIALCMKSCSVYLGGTLQKVLGGTWVTDQGHVGVVASNAENFKLVDVQSPEHQVSVIADHKREIDELRAAAASHGFVVLHDGEFTLNKR